MPFKYERSVLEANINIPLLNAIIAFVLDTAKTAYAQKSQLQKRCILLYQDSCSDMFQETYGFLYLGELLERYEERFGMSIQDRRAIACRTTRTILFWAGAMPCVWQVSWSPALAVVMIG